MQHLFVAVLLAFVAAGAGAQPAARVVPALDASAAVSMPAAPAAAASQPERRRPPVVQVTPTPIRERVEPLDATTKLTIRQGAEWLDAENRPTAGEDGRVTFTFGAGMPVVICAPLRLCVIELQPGERVSSAPQIGDAVRWIVTPAESSSGKTAQTLIVIKPKESGLDTNLLIPTDRRSYYLRLQSRATSYVARVAFSYPDDAKAAWDAYAARRSEQAKSEVSPDLSPMSIDRLNFDYKIEGESSFRPVRVVDNGEKTYIQLPPGSKADEIPVLVVLNTEGKEQLVNSRFINGWFEVDRLFERAALILGVGDEQRKVTIINSARYKPRRSFWSFTGDR